MAERSSDIATSADPALIATVRAYVQIVRAKLRDYPELNRLIAGRETSDREIAMALMEAVSDFNTTPPLIGTYTVVGFPSQDLLINGAVIVILESAGLLQTRNHAVYNDPGVVATSDKGPAYMQWANLFRSTYEQKKVRLKRALNLQAAMGSAQGVSSEFLEINGYFDDVYGDSSQ
mgnify:CR=1 FL=1